MSALTLLADKNQESLMSLTLTHLNYWSDHGVQITWTTKTPLTLTNQSLVRTYSGSISLFQTRRPKSNKCNSANLQIWLMNATLSGNLDYNSMDATQKTMISKLEVQAGLPVGFTSQLMLTQNRLFTTPMRGLLRLVLEMPTAQLALKTMEPLTQRKLLSQKL